jgi:hypothetical protein
MIRNISCHYVFRVQGEQSARSATARLSQDRLDDGLESKAVRVNKRHRMPH